jgi:hypothetical protein
MLSRLREIVFHIQRRSPGARFAESIRRVIRLARLMTAVRATERRQGTKRGKG